MDKTKIGTTASKNGNDSKPMLRVRVDVFFLALSFGSLLHQIVLTIFSSLVVVSHIMISQMEFCLQINLNGSHISLNAETFRWLLAAPTL